MCNNYLMHRRSWLLPSAQPHHPFLLTSTLINIIKFLKSNFIKIAQLVSYYH
jgi:hypothetical protein